MKCDATLANDNFNSNPVEGTLRTKWFVLYWTAMTGHWRNVNTGK